ncbi:MAG: hypothetical protein JWM86_2485 [Thermoleophilia bacterium]|nr:hypothetical protein [Thermoleophilia bacterium]
MYQRSTSATPDQRIAAIATSQGGVITHAELRSCGLDDAAILRRVRRGRLFRRYPRVYTVGHEACSRSGELHAALLYCGEGSAIARSTALEVHGIWRERPGRIHVVCGHRCRTRAGLAVHVARSLHADDTVDRRGIRVTTMARTLVDLAFDLEPLQLANVMHEASFRRRLNLRQLRTAIRRMSTSAAYPTIVEALAMHLDGSAGSKSSLERRFLALLVAHGIPRPQVNVSVVTPAGHVEVDFSWPDRRVSVEVDGSGHGRARTRRDDTARDALLQAAGWTVLRCSGIEVDLDPEGVVARIRSALEAAARERGT